MRTIDVNYMETNPCQVNSSVSSCADIRSYGCVFSWRRPWGGFMLFHSCCHTFKARPATQNQSGWLHAFLATFEPKMPEKGLCHTVAAITWISTSYVSWLSCPQVFFKSGINLGPQQVGWFAFTVKKQHILNSVDVHHGKHGYLISIRPISRLFHLRLLLMAKLVKSKNQCVKTSMVPVVEQQNNHLGDFYKKIQGI